MWASPDRMAGLAPFLIAMVGVIMVLGVTMAPAVTGGRTARLIGRIQPRHVAIFFIILTILALITALFGSRWPSYKLPWLSEVYAMLPSIRSLPFLWAKEGLQPNQTGGFLAVCTAVMAAMALSPRRAREAGSAGRLATETPGRWTTGTPGGWTTGPAWRWTTGFLTVAGLLVVVMTGSRAATAGLLAAVLVILILRTRRLWIWGAGIGIVAVGLHASGHLNTVLGFILRDETLETKLVARLDIWSSALKGVQDHLLTGIGLGVFNDVMPARYPYQTVGLAHPVSQAHNLFLDVALSIGVIGAVGLAMLLLGSVILALAGSKETGPSGALSLGIISSIVAFMVFGITDSISLSLPTSFVVWIWASASMILHVHSLRERAHSVELATVLDSIDSER